MSTMQVSTSSVKADWRNFVEKTEIQYQEDEAVVESEKIVMVEALQNCLHNTKLASNQWTTAQDSLLKLEKNNTESVEEIVRGGMDANHTLRTRFSSAVSSALEDADIASMNLLSSINYSLELDHDACGNLDSKITPSCGELRELKNGHYQQIVDITENAGQCLLEEYMVDQASSLTPKKRMFNLPTIESIEDLRTGAFDELIKTFWGAKSSKQATNGGGGEVKQHIVEAVHSVKVNNCVALVN